MSMATAAEYVLLLTAPDPPPAQAAPGAARLSAREREIVTLVARGQTDAQIAGQLYISVSTVRSHLDRIRDKSGCRRRAVRRGHQTSRVDSDFAEKLGWGCEGACNRCGRSAH